MIYENKHRGHLFEHCYRLLSSPRYCSRLSICLFLATLLPSFFRSPCSTQRSPSCRLPGRSDLLPVLSLRTARQRRGLDSCKVLALPCPLVPVV